MNTRIFHVYSFTPTTMYGNTYNDFMLISRIYYYTYILYSALHIILCRMHSRGGLLLRKPYCIMYWITINRIKVARSVFFARLSLSPAVAVESLVVIITWYYAAAVIPM